MSQPLRRSSTGMSRWTRRRAGAVLMLTAVTLGVTTVTATGGEVEDYPEFPYPSTNYQEDNRGQHHFSSRGGWMNDVNAPLYYDGLYHLYYQHNPHGLEWDTMHWGHATSADLVHWKQQPIALEPGVHPGDLFSGGGVVDTNNVSGLKSGDEDPIIVYSGTNGVRAFYSNDGGYTFETYDGGNPIATPAGTSRDPKVAWDPESQKWIMVVWSDEGGNGVNFYSSENLLDWEYESRFAAGWLFECPDFVEMETPDGGTTWMLSDAQGEYVLGDYTNGEFSTDWATPQRVNLNASGPGGEYYAALTFENLPDDRVVNMAWQGGNRGSVWTGNATFPVEMELAETDDGLRVRSTPVAELENIRGRSTTFEDVDLTPAGAETLLDNVEADTYEVTATFDLARNLELERLQDVEARQLAAIATVSKQIRTSNQKIKSLKKRIADLEPHQSELRTKLRRQLEAERRTNVRLTTRRTQLRSDLATTREAMDVERDRPAATAFGLRLHTDADGWHDAEVTYDVAARTLDGSPLPAGDDPNKVKMQLLVDRGQLEIFGSDGLYYKSRNINFDSLPGGDGVDLYADGHVVLESLKITDLKSIWKAAGESTLRTNIEGPWYPHGGTWTESADGKQGTSTGDAWYLSKATGGDFVLEGDVRIDSGQAAALTFRADRNLTRHYTINVDSVDSGGMVKLWRAGGVVLDTVPFDVEIGRFYHFKVEVDGSRIKVFVDGSEEPLVDVVDDSYTEGQFGLQVFRSTATFQNVTVTPLG
ncbi:sucrose-6-phosphate hydrolase SacC (GH32 family) [Nocardioides thalensis]|uniref:Sucrose-6-phosphate hydrolase SacC (GH32 family) n=1 Tax=Nocardioides thalensis TaxID=1914755 RepID=A0A853C880_9ACTN|nr:GH32 C-terminal domain-containing protein [Nocardioides thalensis]NYJ03361.1 sucrose-6-phosphate hydrolase SacC (GH32 family) [Nocardioides thalensis]